MLDARLILFDIDGTLLSCGAQVKEIFRRSLADVFGTAGDVDGYDFSGKTDHQIVGELLAGEGLDAAAIAAGLPRAKAIYVERLARELARETMTLLPGVLELLERLGGDGRVVLGLLTGNWEQGGRVKLGRFGLNRFFAFGAFGDDQPDRLGLPPLALRRASEASGGAFTPAETLIIGDSPLDVACAREHGIRCFAVATGRSSAAELAAAGADHVIDRLSDLTGAGGASATPAPGPMPVVPRGGSCTESP